MAEALSTAVVIRADHLTLCLEKSAEPFRRRIIGREWKFQTSFSVDFGEITLTPLVVARTRVGDQQRRVWLEQERGLYPVGPLLERLDEAIAEYTQSENFTQQSHRGFSQPYSFKPRGWHGKSLEVPVSYLQISRFWAASTNRPIRADLKIGHYLRMFNATIFERKQGASPQERMAIDPMLFRPSQLRDFINLCLKNHDLHRILSRIINFRTRNQASESVLLLPKGAVTEPVPPLQLV